MTIRNLNQFATGQAQPGLSASVLNIVDMTVPANPAEQRSIAPLDARLSAQAEKLAALRHHERGLIQQLFPSPED